MTDLTESMWNLSLQRLKIMSTSGMLMANKVNRMLTYHERLPLIKLHNILITWPCEITC